MKNGRENVLKTMLCILFTGIWWEYFFLWFPIAFVFLLFLYFVTMYLLYVKVNRDCLSLFLSLESDTEIEVGGLRYLLRNNSRERKKNWAVGKLKLWCRWNKALANPAGSCKVSIACSGVLLRAKMDGSLCVPCSATIAGCCLHELALYSQGQLAANPCLKGDLSNASSLYHTVL